MKQVYSEDLVLRVNELFYDLIDDQYDDVHREMEGAELKRWRENVARYLNTTDPLTIADIGSGSGLVGTMIAPMLKRGDLFICADLSSGMLERAESALRKPLLQCRLDFRKIERGTPIRLPFDDGTLDAVTMNSVLHHIKETEEFLREIDRVLKPGGLYFLGHEPNSRFVESRVLRLNYAVLKGLLMPRHTLIKASHRLGLYPLMLRLYHAVRPAKRSRGLAQLGTINSTLRAEGLIERDLTFEEIAGITDIRDSEGFDAQQLYPGFEPLSLETYNHMLLISIKHGDRSLVRNYESILRRRYPDRGATFFAVFRKHDSSSHT